VSAQREIPMPVPPPPIASDPERLAMWRDHYTRMAEQDPRQVVVVTGCGAHTTYACWEFGGMREMGQKSERVTIGSSCNAVGVEAQGSVSRSTTDELQPKTTASSR
jgi:hypothetical protein